LADGKIRITASSWDDAKVIWPNQVLEVAVIASRSVWCAPWRLSAVRPGLEPLARCDRELVVNPTMRRVPLPCDAVLGGNIHVGLDVRKILLAPGVGFVNRHYQRSRKPLRLPSYRAEKIRLFFPH
jgi:hypothetical protein